MQPAAEPATATSAADTAPPAGEQPPAASEEPNIPAIAARILDRKWTGDLDGMIKRRLIRVLVPYSKTQYFIDQGVQRGLAYEAGKKFEDEVNARLKTGNLRIQVVFVPMSRDQLFPALLDGRGDLVAAALTVTPERLKQVAFGPPTRKNVSEIVVTGPGVPGADESRRPRGPGSVRSQVELVLREPRSTQRPVRSRKGRSRSLLTPAPETLEDEDLLEMVNAGLVKIVVVDDYLAQFWKQIFTSIELHPSVAVRTGGVVAPAIRPNSPKLEAALAEFQKRFGAGTTFGNVAAAALSEEHEVREERGRRRGHAALAGRGGALQEVRRPVPTGLAADGGPELPGVGARSLRRRATSARLASCR